MALLRLAHPTSIFFRYAARIRYAADGQVEPVVPGLVTGHGANAFVAGQNHRDWLVEDDLKKLKNLVGHLAPNNLPPRVRRAFWYHEFAARTEYVDVRWTLVSTALEALVHTDREQSTKQFKKRVPQLAAEVGLRSFTGGGAETAYDRRSSLAHRQGLASFSGPDRQLYDQIESILHEALKRAVLDPTFAGVFTNETAIRKRWPL